MCFFNYYYYYFWCDSSLSIQQIKISRAFTIKNPALILAPPSVTRVAANVACLLHDTAE